jgi:hypothetical protein
MLFILALFAVQTGAASPLIDEVVNVQPMEIKVVSIALPQRPALVDCRFHVAGEHPGVRAIFMTSTDAERFRNGLAHAALAATAFQPKGALRVAVAKPGEYAIVLDNRLEGQLAAPVRLRVWLTFQEEPAVDARYAAPRRQALAIALGFTFFLMVAGFAGWKIRKATGSPRPPQQFF